MIWMKRRETHPCPLSCHNGSVGARETDAVLPRHADDLFPVKPLINEHVLPNHLTNLHEGLDDLLQVRNIKVK
jgi:hypothetical protein